MPCPLPRCPPVDSPVPLPPGCPSSPSAPLDLTCPSLFQFLVYCVLPGTLRLLPCCRAGWACAHSNRAATSPPPAQELVSPICKRRPRRTEPRAQPRRDGVGLPWGDLSPQSEAKAWTRRLAVPPGGQSDS